MVRFVPLLVAISILLAGTASSQTRAPLAIASAAYLTQAGVNNTFVRLADRGVHGNAHMMMLEKNSDAIAPVMEIWVSSAVR